MHACPTTATEYNCGCRSFSNNNIEFVDKCDKIIRHLVAPRSNVVLVLVKFAVAQLQMNNAASWRFRWRLTSEVPTV